MKSVPVSVWLSAVVLFIFSAHSAWQDPVFWFQCFIFVSIAASFGRVVVYLFEGK